MHPNNITYKMIAKYLNQSEANIKALKKKHHEKLELYKYGIAYMLEHEIIKIEDFMNENEPIKKQNNQNSMS